MIHARINQGRVEVEEPIPAAWEGHRVKLVPLTPDDPISDLEQQLEALHAMGPMEYEPGEQEQAESLLREMNEISKAAMARLSDPLK